ncbi:hypothetical protein ABQE69_08885 [Mycolicibacillus trivialis]
MELNLGSSARAVVAGLPRSRMRYGQRPDGSRGQIGVETGQDGQPLAQLPATLVGGPAGWVESATVVAPSALLADAPPPGTLIELTGSMTMSVRGKEFGATRSTVTGVVGVRTIGSAIEPLLGSEPVAAATKSVRS